MARLTMITILLLSGIFFCSTSIYAQGLALGNITVPKGSNTNLPLVFVNDGGNSIVALQLDVTFDDTFLTLNLATEGVDIGTHKLRSFLISPTQLRLVIYSLDNNPVPNGTLVNLPFFIDEAAPEISNTIVVSGTVLANILISSVPPGTITNGTITVSGVPNDAPNGVIDAPVVTQNIAFGESVSFSGTGSDPDGNTPLTYLWNFDGGATNSNLEDPGSIPFTAAGSFDITFTVTDSFGLSDPTPAEVTVIVVANQAPESTILSPTGQVTVDLDQEVDFSGVGSDPEGHSPFTFFWSFGGGASNSTFANPTNVAFNTPGTYTVSFTVADSFGLADPTPAEMTIIVRNNQEPNGTIEQPTDPTVGLNQPVFFSGTGLDSDGHNPLSYLWTFDGGAPNNTNEDPGNITFTSIGTYDVLFTVSDAYGLADSSPASKQITVQENQAPTSTFAFILCEQNTTSTPVSPGVNDPDIGDSHTFAVMAQGNHGVAVPTNLDSQFLFIPASGYLGTDSFTYRATDDGGLFVDGTANVNIIDSTYFDMLATWPDDDVRIILGILFPELLASPSLMVVEKDFSAKNCSEISFIMNSNPKLFHEHSILRVLNKHQGTEEQQETWFQLNIPVDFKGDLQILLESNTELPDMVLSAYSGQACESLLLMKKSKTINSQHSMILEALNGSQHSQIFIQWRLGDKKWEEVEFIFHFWSDASDLLNAQDGGER